jgi:hypothetical protein
LPGVEVGRQDVDVVRRAVGRERDPAARREGEEPFVTNVVTGEKAQALACDIVVFEHATLGKDAATDAALEVVVVFGELIRRGGEWVFSANSAGFPGGLDGLCRQYGVSV